MQVRDANPTAGDSEDIPTCADKGFVHEGRCGTSSTHTDQIVCDISTIGYCGG